MDTGVQPLLSLGNLLTIFIIILGLVIQYAALIKSISRLEGKYEADMRHSEAEFRRLDRQYSEMCNKYHVLCKEVYVRIGRTENEKEVSS